MRLECPVCKCEFEKETSAINRANKDGLKLYCGRKCAGLGRRTNKDLATKRKEKSEYDKAYRAKNLEEIKRKKHEYFMKDYAANPEKYREMRKGQRANHLRHINTPEYKKWKQEYDKRYHSETKYGEFWEAAVILNEIETILVENTTRFERYIDRGSYNKSQKRKRLCKKMQTN